MKRIDKAKLYFWSGLTGMNSLFIVVFLWSMIPFGGETLPHAIEQLWAIPFLSSAILVSLFWGVLAAGIILLLTLQPAAVRADETERSMQRPLK